MDSAQLLQEQINCILADDEVLVVPIHARFVSDAYEMGDDSEPDLFISIGGVGGGCVSLPLSKLEWDCGGAYFSEAGRTEALREETHNVRCALKAATAIASALSNRLAKLEEEAA